MAGTTPAPDGPLRANAQPQRVGAAFQGAFARVLARLHQVHVATGGEQPIRQQQTWRWLITSGFNGKTMGKPWENHRKMEVYPLVN